MRFELDDALMNDILFNMENQKGEFLLDTQKGQVIDINNNDYDEEPDYNDSERFAALPEWSPREGFRLMEKFTAGLKNPVLRHELSLALSRNRGVFRFFKNVIEQYPETEKLWFSYKEREMKREVLAWYNALREEWGLQPIGSEPEDTSSLVLEDFVLRPGNENDREKAQALRKLSAEEHKDKEISSVYESMNPFIFPGDLCFTAENASGDFCGCISAVKDAPSTLRICALEVKSEYRTLGLGKALLSKLLENAGEQKLAVIIDLPADREYFSRTLRLEEFKPCVQRYIRVN
jgi:ribosomal protein S18 acetylase RimI-like enzyme